jgi:hypothetical protein
MYYGNKMFSIQFDFLFVQRFCAFIVLFCFKNFNSYCSFFQLNMANPFDDDGKHFRVIRLLYFPV